MRRLALALIAGVLGGCFVVRDLVERDRVPAAPPGVDPSSTEPRPSIRGKRPVSFLPDRPEDEGDGRPLTKGVNLVWSTDYRPNFWALGFTGVRIWQGVDLTPDRRARFVTSLEGGAGAGIGGAECVSEESCAQQGDGPRWYEGVAYGGYVGAGAAVLTRWASLYFTLRLQVSQATSIPRLYRFIGSIGLQVPLRGRFSVYVTTGYLMDWDDEASHGGPAVEVGLHRPLSLFGTE